MSQTKETSHLLISTTPAVRQRFKEWCKSQDISMNKAFGLFMRQASNGTNWKIKQAIIRRVQKQT